MTEHAIVEKIQKLLALATSPNEHEAQLAATKANELLIKHNLSVDQVASITNEDHYTNNEVYTNKVMAFEVRWVMMVIRKHFFVDPVYKTSHRYGTKKTAAQVWFVGKKTNVQVASYIFNFLVQKYRQLWKQYQLESGAPNESKASYYQGLTNGLDSQLEKTKKKVEQETALVVVRDPNLDKQVQRFHDKTKNASGPNGGNDYDAYMDGRIEGRNIKISRGIEDRNTNSSSIGIEHKKG